MYQRGGEHAKVAKKKVEDILLKEQSGKSGAWIGSGQENSHGEIYCTCMAVLALAVKYHYLPIYQR